MEPTRGKVQPTARMLEILSAGGAVVMDDGQAVDPVRVVGARRGLCPTCAAEVVRPFRDAGGVARLEDVPRRRSTAAGIPVPRRVHYRRMDTGRVGEVLVCRHCGWRSPRLSEAQCQSFAERLLTAAEDLRLQ